MNGKIRLGVAGVGSLGRHHARVAALLPEVEASGIFDSDAARAREVAGEFHLPVCRNLEELIEKSDALIVATPTVTHRGIAAAALSAGRHVLVEKPITATLAEADELVGLAHRQGVVLQVGHIERFNPAIDAALPYVREARFIEAHRLSVFTARSLDVDVVLDLMIHDIQIAQAFAGRAVRDVRAVGVAVLTPKIDIANARIEFEGGCVANLTASRVSADKIRKFRVFSRASYVSIDMTSQEISAALLELGVGGTPAIVPLSLAVVREEPLVREVAGFIKACRTGSTPLVSGEDGREALALALAVRQAVEAHQERLA